MITILLSTIIPRVTIRAASVTVLSSIPHAIKTPRAISIAIGMVAAATLATRIGNSSMITNITEQIDINNSCKNSTIEWITNVLWSVIGYIDTSDGNERLKFFIIPLT